MTAGALASFALVMLAVNASPGPGTATIVGATLSGGVRAGIAAFAGSLIGDYVYFIAAVLGSGAIAHALGSSLPMLMLLAGLYLLWLGTASFRKAGAPAPVGQPVAAPALTPRAGFVSGFFITLGNPNVIFLFLALLPAVTDLRHLRAADIAILTVILVAASAGVFAVLIGLAAAARRYALAGARGIWAERISGGVLALAGLWLILEAGLKLLGAKA